jgi:hypothetical protein
MWQVHLHLSLRSQRLFGGYEHDLITGPPKTEPVAFAK